MKAKLLLIITSFLLCFFVYPSAFIYPQETLPDTNDTRLIAYIIGQVQDNIIHLQPLHYGRFFAPDPNTLTYSDLFLTTSILTLPAQIFTHHPIIIFNLAFILNFVLTCYFAFSFFDYLFKNKFTSTLTTLLFILSGYHLHYYPHLQIFSLWLFFAALLNLQKYLNTNQTKYLAFFFIFSTFQLAETIFTFYLLFFASIIITMPVVANFRKAELKQSPTHGLPRPFGLAMTILFPILWFLLLSPYAKTHLLYPEATRPIRDAAHFSLGLDNFFNLYHGWTIILILIIGATAHTLSGNYSQEQKRGIFLLRKIFAPRPKQLRTAGVSRLWFTETGVGERHWMGLFIFSIIMSLGPVLKIFDHTVKIFGLPIPLPYTLFYYLFPGFTGFRTPSRFTVLALFSVCIIIGYQLNILFKHLQTKTKIFFLITAFCLLVLEARLPLTGYPVNINPHPVYEQVKNLPSSAVILELPIKLWNNSDNEIESIRSLYSLYHKHRRLGGYSGFATYDWINTVQEIQSQGLSNEIITKLKSLGITHIIRNNALSPIK